MDRIVNCGILGAGWWATTAHLPALKAHPQAQVVAVQKRDRASAQKVADDFGVEHAVTSVEEMLEIGGLDAVVVSTTPNMHYEQAKRCLEQGLHVLVEKPMTMNVDEARELVDLAREKGLQILISCPWHYTDHGEEARRLIREGAVGAQKMVSILYTNFSGGLYRARTWKELFSEGGEEKFAEPYLTPRIDSYSDPAIAGGGHIFSQVSHAAAYLGFLTGSDPVEVFARFDYAGTALDIYDVLCVKLENGCLVNLASTGDTMLSKRHFEVRLYGTEGMILLELWDGTMELHRKGREPIVYPTLDPQFSYPLQAPAENMVEAILGQEENRSPGELGLYAMKIIEASCQSAHDGFNVTVT